MVDLEFEGDDLKRRVGNPNIHSVLEYSAITGVTRSLVKGGAKYHQMLLKAFAEHLLHVKVYAHRLMPPTLDLSVLPGWASMSLKRRWTGSTCCR
ncbi:MAG TPA: hypothetical protein ACQGQH_00440 [Xylella sp.]